MLPSIVLVCQPAIVVVCVCVSAHEALSSTMVCIPEILAQGYPVSYH